MIKITETFAVYIFCICTSITSCTNGNSRSGQVNTQTNDSLIPNKNSKSITYHFDSIVNDSALIIFYKLYSKEQIHTIAAINRIDERKIGVNSKLIIPDSLYSDLLVYAPFPMHLDIPDSIQKFVLINQRIQWFGMYENKKLIRTGPVSTGRKKMPTPNKLYYTNFKAKRKVSTVNGSWIMPWYFNISNYGGIGMHQYTLPGYPASHSCIRLYQSDAKWFFDWAQQWTLSADQSRIVKYGTPVLVFGNYDFNNQGPWKLLPIFPDTLKLTENELKSIDSAIMHIKIYP